MSNTVPDEPDRILPVAMVAGQAWWSPRVAGMTVIKLLVLLLALSGAVNVAFVAGIIARLGGLSIPRCILVAGGAAGASLTIFFTALPSYQ